jgi:hypothetical protein
MPTLCKLHAPHPRPKNKEWLKKKPFWDMVFEDYNKNRVFERLARLLET